MTIRIEAGGITQHQNGDYKRFLSVIDDNSAGAIMSRTIYAKTKEELEIIDHENFMKE